MGNKNQNNALHLTDSSKMVIHLYADELQSMIRECVEESLKGIREKLLAPPEEIMDSEQICHEFGISLPTLMKYRRGGIIPFFYVGTRVRFKRMEVMGAFENLGKTRK